MGKDPMMKFVAVALLLLATTQVEAGKHQQANCPPEGCQAAYMPANLYAYNPPAQVPEVPAAYQWLDAQVGGRNVKVWGWKRRDGQVGYYEADQPGYRDPERIPPPYSTSTNQASAQVPTPPGDIGAMPIARNYGVDLAGIQAEVNRGPVATTNDPNFNALTGETLNKPAPQKPAPQSDLTPLILIAGAAGLVLWHRNRSR